MKEALIVIGVVVVIFVLLLVCSLMKVASKCSREEERRIREHELSDM